MLAMKDASKRNTGAVPQLCQARGIVGSEERVLLQPGVHAAAPALLWLLQWCEQSGDETVVMAQEQTLKSGTVF